MQTNTYNTIYSQQYLTMYNGMRFTISLHSYNGELSDTDTAILQTVVDSLHFTETLENPNGISKKSQTDYYSVIRTGSLAASLGVILLGILGILISRQKNKRIKS